MLIVQSSVLLHMNADNVSINDIKGNIESNNILVLCSERTLHNFVIFTEDVLKTRHPYENKQNSRSWWYQSKKSQGKKSERDDVLTSLFEICQRRGLVLADWKTLNATPFFRKSYNNTPANHKPVSLTIVGKMLKSIIGDKNCWLPRVSLSGQGLVTRL